MSLPLLLAAVLTASFQTPPDGVFQSRGYGWIITRSHGDFRLYHQAGNACWPDPDGAELADIFASARPRADGSIGLTEAGTELATVYVFDRLPTLPAACASPDAGHGAAVTAIADLMQAHYPAFEPRGVDFAVRRQAVLGALPADAGADVAFEAAERLLAGLNDPHIDLSAEIAGEETSLEVSQGRTLDAIAALPGDRPERTWLRTWREGVEQGVLGGEGHVAGADRLFWGVRDGVGYLAVLTMGGFDPDAPEATEALEAALDEAMAAFADARAVVVDVSNNRGGYDSMGRLIAGRFASEPTPAYSKRGWGAGVEPQRIEVSPSSRARYTGPVWLLTSDITVSAGETFTQMMRSLPTVTHAGTPTRGALSDQIPVRLANGWSFAMPMELYADPEGRPLEGAPIKPDVALELYPAEDLGGGHARAVRRLMTRLAASPVGRP